MKHRIGLSVLLCAVFGLSGCALFGGNGQVISAKALMATPETRILPNRALPFCSEPADDIHEIYMVMPEAGGKVGTVVVNLKGGGETVLHGHYSAMSLSSAGKKTYVGDEQQMRSLFGDSLKMLPELPMYMQLNFQQGSDELTPESKLAAEKIFGEIAKRKTLEVVLTGHTDTVDTAANNLRLSLARAKAVQSALVAQGVPASMIEIVGRGEQDLLIKTPDNVAKPENRRVEMNIR